MTTFIADYLLGSPKRSARSGSFPALRLFARLRAQPEGAPRADHPTTAAADRRPDLDDLPPHGRPRDRLRDAPAR